MFLSNLIDFNPELTCHAFYKMIKRLKNPIKTKKEVLVTLKKCGLKEITFLLDEKC